MKHRILIVDDEPDILEFVKYNLAREGYEVFTAQNGAEALAAAAEHRPHLILLDVMMPKLDGYSLLGQLRDKNFETPVLLLTARDAVADRVKGLDMGADDYLVKPFAFDELLARIRAMTRKRAGNCKNQFSLADLTVDIERRRVFRDGKEITLIPKEFSLLEYLIRHQGIVLSREQMENQIWNYEFSGSSNNIDVYISRLRKKIDAGYKPRLLHTIRGVGWVLRADDAGELP